MTGADVRGRRAPAFIAWSWLWFAVLTGLAELGVLAYRGFLFGDTLWVSRQVVWMAPLANLVVFAVPALMLVILARRHPERSWVGVTAGAFAFLAFFIVLLMYPLHRIAVLILAAGLAYQAGRLAHRHAAGFHRLVRGTAAWLAAAVLAVGLGWNAFGWFAERRAVATLPEAEGPNVLLIILDTVRARSLSLYGHERPTTPRLERLASRGVTFDWALSPSPWTLPGHASMFTGHYPHELAADWNVPLDDADSTLAEYLGARGYATAGFVANLAYATFEHGLDRGFIRYEDYPLSLSQLALSSTLGRSVTNNPTVRRLIGERDILNRKSADRISRDFLGWLEGNQDHPFFIFLNYYDAHEPYLPPAPFDTLFGPNDAERPFSYFVNEAWRTDKWELSPEEMAVERAAYEGAIAYLDERIGALFDELDGRGVLENTVVIITSDHGEHFGEHGLVDHGNSLYQPLLHVPLLMMGPGVPADRRIGSPVTLRDLPATIVELLGLDESSPFPGESLARHWSSGDSSGSAPDDTLLAHVTGGRGNEREPIHRGDLHALVAGGYHYIRNGDGEEELYDFFADPAATENLAEVAELAEVMSAFRRHLRKAMGVPAPADAVGATSGTRAR